MENKNVFGDPLMICSQKPLTGYFRDGCCNTDGTDFGLHTVCIIATKEFLIFSANKGNDLSTPYPKLNFLGIKPGDRWCLCALRWKEAYLENCAPKVVLEATNEKTLEVVTLEELIEHAHYKPEI